MARDNGVHVLLGTRKGAYVVDGDTKRARWKVRGPFHPGGDVFMLAADPRAPGTIYAAVNNPFWGPMLHRSTDWGRKWKEVSLPNMPRGTKRTPPEDGRAKYPVVNTWQIVPGRDEEPKSLLLGIDPASLWRSNDRAETWEPVPGLNDHPSRPRWNPGAGGMCLHTILRDPTNPKRLYVAISAAGGFRSDDDGEHWTPINKGVVVSFGPEKRPEVGQCLHKLALEPSNPSTIYRQDHDGIYVTHDRGERWTHVGQALPHDFGFVVASSSTAPGGAYFVPLDPEGRTTWDHQLQVFRWEDKAKKFRPLVPKGAFPGVHGTHRDGLATDALEPTGIYLGTTTGHLYYSPNAGRAWREVPFNFPAIHSVQVAGPAA
jgi:hypothetical protein